MKYFKFSLESDGAITKTAVILVLVGMYFIVLVASTITITAWNFNPASIRLIFISAIIAIAFAHINYRLDKHNE